MAGKNPGGIVGGIALALLAGAGVIGKLALRSGDDVVRGVARFGDDVAGSTARFGDDVAQSARFGDDIAGAGVPRFGDDVVQPARFGDDVAASAAPTATWSPRVRAAAQQSTQLQKRSVEIGERIETLRVRVPPTFYAHLMTRYRRTEEQRKEINEELKVANDPARLDAVQKRLAALAAEQQAIERVVADAELP